MTLTLASQPRYTRVRALQDLARHRRAGFLVILAFVAITGGWGATARLLGAVTAPGQIVVAGDVKKVQHPGGGVVAELLVREGDRVAAGQVVMRLDPTQFRANADMVARQLFEAQVRRARLEAERDAAPRIDPPPVSRGDAAEAARIVAAEQRLFETRRAANEGRRGQLRSRLSQLRSEIAGLQAQLKGRETELTVTNRDLANIRDLFDKRLVQVTRLNTAERDVARLEGQRGETLAEIARVEGRLSETELQIIQADEDFRAAVLDDLRATQSREGDLMEKLVATEDLLARVVIAAPVSGTVHQLAIHTVGGVLGAGEVAMQVVPSDEQLEAEVRLLPTDVDQIRQGQTTRVKLMAGNQRTTPELAGTVSRISPNVARQETAGLPYYAARITISPEEVARLAPLKLIAGMQVEAFVETSERSPLDFLMKPIVDQLSRAFRER